MAGSDEFQRPHNVIFQEDVHLNLEVPHTTESALSATVDLLTKSGFLRLDIPYAIGDTEFDFGIPFVSGSGYLDLVLVKELGTVSDEILRSLKSIAQALDVARSSMALTLIVVGRPARGVSSFREAQALARVLVVDTNQTVLSVEEQIAPLLPLTLNTAVQELLEDPMKSLHDLAQNGSYPRFLHELIHHSQDGRETVEHSLLDWFEEPMRQITRDDTSGEQK
ncbi:hypothetical protein ACFC25_18165 [Pseudarthrobacter sp. NPDC055928]|uniref:hypothetical protein n=1 Tax=Pseudarthrobacter sp. NPDC055928 TaxID=3345661 RepID=UPI0035DF5B28